MTAVLEARDLTLRLGKRDVLRGVSLSLSPGDCVALIGPNGAGKTSLLRVLLGLAHPHEGEVLLDGRSLAVQARRAIARRMAYVPQAHVPSFPYSVREIVAMGRTPATGWGGRFGRADDEAVARALARIGMQDFSDRSYAELSGGERQAVLIARALAQGAQILLMDEPTASLDLGQRTRLMSLLGRLSGEGHAILLSIHQPELALQWFNRAMLLRQGVLIRDGAPRAIVTSESLSELYGVTVKVVEASGVLHLSALA